MLPGTPLRAAFDSESVKPGTSIVVTATGAPSCRVFFAATDASVALLAGSGGDAALNASGILTAAGAAETAALDSAGGGSGGVGGSGCWSAPEWWRAGAVLATSLAQGSCQDGGGGGIMQAAHFKGGGAEMAMNARAVAMPFAVNAVMDDGSGGGGGGGGAEPPRERTSFPETWIWTSADADAKGAAALGGLLAPDTLTAWQLSAFSLHPVDGIQVAPPPTPLTVHQPLSLRLALPPSAVRGERLTLRAALYSALPAQTVCTVKLQLDDASGLVLAAGQSAEARLILPPTADKNSPTSAGVSFQVTPTQLGPITVRLLATSDGPEGDALSSQLLVVPEGLPEEVTSNGVLNASAASAAARTLTLSAPVPASAVPGSARSTLSVTGDIMGPSLQGLGRLLVVPTGCGEQTMIGVAPNVAVLQYSAALPTPLSAQLVESAKANAALGWQRELTYRHPDGSFSAFGTTDVSGSTWLTAFVLRVFSASMPFIQIDATALAAASSWLAGLQNTDGSFRSVGNVIHTDMVGGGGAAANFSLTAFVLAALLEAPPGIAPPSAVVHAAVRFLLPPPPDGAYARHVRAHSLALACGRGIEGACEATDAALTDLMSRLAPDEEGGLPHWRVGEAAAPANGCWQAPPADIELTGYGVLALLARGRAADAAGPARWLVSQRNGGGGFGSTQDTVVGLAALSGFAAATSGSPPALTLTVALASNKGTPWKTVHVDASNSGVLQQFEAPPGAELIVTGDGVGAALLQLTSRFSVLPAPTVVVDDAASAPAFLLSTEALNITTAHRRRRSLLEAQAGASTTVLHHRTCFARAAGSHAAGGSTADEGMVLLSVGLFSGYSPVASSLAAAQASAPHLVKRVEAAEDGRGVSFYLDKLAPSDGGFCLSFDAQQTADVAQLAPASASLHSYYSPQQRAATSLAASDVRPAAERPPSGVAPASPSAFLTRVRARPIRPSGGAWSRWAVKGTLLAGASVALLCVWWPSGIGKLARAALRRLQRKD